MKRDSMRFFEANNDGNGGGNGDGQQQQQQAGSADAWNWTTPEGTLNPGWADRLPEDLKPDTTAMSSLVDKYGGSLPKLLKGALHLQSVAGKKLGAPAEDWSPEMLAEYRKAHGIPDTAEAYNLKPEQLPEGMEFVAELFAPLAKLAHERHIPEAAMRDIAGQFIEMTKSRQQAALQMIAEEDSKAVEALKKEWGPSEYEARIDRATRAAQYLGFDTDPNKNPIANHPVVIKLLDRVAKEMGESKLVTSGVAPTSQPDRVRAMDIMQGKDKQYSDDYFGNNGPDRQLAAQKVVMDLLKNSQ